MGPRRTGVLEKTARPDIVKRERKRKGLKEGKRGKVVVGLSSTKEQSESKRGRRQSGDKVARLVERQAGYGLLERVEMRASALSQREEKLGGIIFAKENGAEGLNLGLHDAARVPFVSRFSHLD